MNDKQLQHSDKFLIGRFHDGEMTEDEQVRIREHLKICGNCRGQLKEYSRISKLVSDGFDRELTAVPNLEYRIIRSVLERNERGFLKRVLSGFRQFTMPVALAACLILFFTWMYWPRTSDSSAIVSSLSGDFSSVMIIDTQASRHTIVWIQEK